MESKRDSIGDGDTGDRPPKQPKRPPKRPDDEIPPASFRERVIEKEGTP